MQSRLFVLLIAAALGIAACGKNEPKNQQPASSGSSAAPAEPKASTPTTPANIGAPASTAESREGAEPHQQHADPKEPAQRRDFEQSGDAAGPRSPETAPKPGS